MSRYSEITGSKDYITTATTERARNLPEQMFTRLLLRREHHGAHGAPTRALAYPPRTLEPVRELIEHVAYSGNTTLGERDKQSDFLVTPSSPRNFLRRGGRNVPAEKVASFPIKSTL